VHFKLLLCSVFLQFSLMEPDYCYRMKYKSGGGGQEIGKNVPKTNFPSRHIILYVHTQ